MGRLAQCESHMRNAALGLAGYLTANGSYPKGTIANSNFLPEDRVSFYAGVTPYFEYSGLYNMIDQSQQWDGGSNILVAGVRIGILQCPGTSRTPEPAAQPTTTIGIAGLGTDAPSLPTSDGRAGIFGYDRRRRPPTSRMGPRTR